MTELEQKHALSITANQGWLVGLSDEEKIRLIEHSRIKTYAKGELIYKSGDTQNGLFCILEGLVKASILSQEGDHFPLTIWEPGCWFGEGAYLEGSVMPLETCAFGEAKLLILPTSTIDSVLDNPTRFYKNVLRELIGRSQMLYKLVEMLLFNTLQARLAARLLHLVNLFGEPGPEGLVLPLEFSQSDFARMSGGSRQRVNMIFRDWASSGVVTKQRKWYVVHDIKALEAEIGSQRKA